MEVRFLFCKILPKEARALYFFLFSTGQLEAQMVNFRVPTFISGFDWFT